MEDVLTSALIFFYSAVAQTCRGGATEIANKTGIYQSFVKHLLHLSLLRPSFLHVDRPRTAARIQNAAGTCGNTEADRCSVFKEHEFI